jgi:hypothetical protein
MAHLGSGNFIGAFYRRVGRFMSSRRPSPSINEAWAGRSRLEKPHQQQHQAHSFSQLLLQLKADGGRPAGRPTEPWRRNDHQY